MSINIYKKTRAQKRRAKNKRKTPKQRALERNNEYQPKIKRTLIKRREKKKEIEVIARKSQGKKWRMRIMAPELSEKVSFGGQVSSSWIAEIDWHKDAQIAYMILLNRYEYFVFIPFRIFERWYYSPSKGTFFNEVIKGKYKVERAR